MFRELLNIFILKKPIKQMVAEKPTFMKAIMAFVVIYLIIQIISTIEGIIITIVDTIVQALLAGNIAMLIPILIPKLAVTIPLGAFLIPAILIINFVLLLIIGGINFVTARLLGGKGKGFVQYFSNLLLLDAAITLGFGIIEIVISLLGFIPVVGQILGILILIPIMLAVTVYSLYLGYKLIKHYFALSTGRAIVTLLLPVVLFLIVGVIIFILFFAAIIALIIGAVGVTA